MTGKLLEASLPSFRATHVAWTHLVVTAGSKSHLLGETLSPAATAARVLP